MGDRLTDLVIMSVDLFLNNCAHHNERPAFIWQERTYSYQWLSERIAWWQERLSGVASQVIAVVGDFSPESIAVCLAAWRCGYTVVPLSVHHAAQHAALLRIAEAECCVTIDAHDQAEISRLPYQPAHALYRTLHERGRPGLVVFTSGSSGQPKGAVHDVVELLDKFTRPRKSFRTIAFLLFDHLGGWNTIWYILANGGTAIMPRARTPHDVLHAVARHRAELLPTTPTFLNLMIYSEAYREHDLTSLQMISYGTEPMPESTLRRCRTLLPHVEFLQTYGLSELGVTRSKSRDSDSLWVKVGGEHFDTRVVDGVLQIKATSMMLGYLNAPSPLTADGWFHTGDLVEQDGEYLRFLGRESEVINVGGEKVFPAEVEAVILAMDNILEATVYGEANPIMGNIVCCTVRPQTMTGDLASLVKRHCQVRLARYKVPVKVAVSTDAQHGSRFKKQRMR